VPPSCSLKSSSETIEVVSSSLVSLILTASSTVVRSKLVSARGMLSVIKSSRSNAPVTSLYSFLRPKSDINRDIESILVYCDFIFTFLLIKITDRDSKEFM
jgi:hypothetical protein